MNYLSTQELLAQMVGKTFVRIEREQEELRFYAADGSGFRFYHDQDCCESVDIEDVIGDLADLVNSPILLAEEAESGENPPGIEKLHQDSFTWTFYKFATTKGYVTVRWYGESNGYYSESVSINPITPTPTPDAPAAQ